MTELPIDTALVAALLCGLGGLLVPPLLARMPEPQLAEDDTGPLIPYTEIAATPGLAVRSAAAAAVAGGLIGLALGWTWPLLLVLPLVPAGVALAVSDWRTHLLPRPLVLGTTGLAAVLALVVWLFDRDTDALVRAGVGLVAARTVFWLLWSVRASGMGFGDVRLAALVGLVLAHRGWAELIVGLWLGMFAFSVPGVLRAARRRDRQVLREAAPLGPFLLVGAVIGLLIGPGLVAR